MKGRIAVAAALCAASFTAAAVVVDSSYTIVLPDYERSGIGAELCRAADTLKAALKEGAGLELQIQATKKFKGGRAIYIGEAAAKRAGLVPSDMKDFSSVIAEKGGDIYVFGCDRAIHPGIGKNPRHMAPVPTLRAIARFMEDYMDVRFLAPGDVGTDIPKIEKVEVPDGTFSRNDPRLEYSVAPHGTAVVYEWRRLSQLMRKDMIRVGSDGSLFSSKCRGASAQSCRSDSKAVYLFQEFLLKFRKIRLLVVAARLSCKSFL